MLNPDSSVEIFREKLTNDLMSGDFDSMGIDELMSMQRRLGMGCEYGVWEFPASCLPDGGLQHRSKRFIEKKSLFSGAEVSEENVDRAWTEILRYGVVRSAVVGLRCIVKPSTASSEMAILLVLARKILSMPLSDGRFWSLLTEEDFSAVSVVGPYLVKTLHSYHKRGLIPDAPFLGSVVVGASPERDRYGEEDRLENIKSTNEWQPFPDKFTSECGWRSLKIIKDLGPTLLGALEAALKVEHLTDLNENILTVNNRCANVTDAQDGIIQGWSWTDRHNNPLYELGFDLYVKSATKESPLGKNFDLKWPPKTFADAWRLLSILQGAHLFPICLASGPRASEVGSLNVCCLESVADGVNKVTGKTFKFADDYGGRDREFVAPDIVVTAIMQQIRLSELVKSRAGVTGDQLWVHLTSYGRSNMGSKHHSLSDFMKSYCCKLNLMNFLEVDSPRVHLHRFRKTLARVVALSLVNSPTILMDCFGHEDPEMTIRSYILSDKKIAQDVLVVQRELVVMMAADIVSNSGDLGGAVGEKLRQRKAQYLQLLGRSEFEPQDAYEFARRETFDGRSWMMVAPGIYCTLPTGEGGLCSRGNAGVNPAYCQAGCPFQLLTTYNKVKTEDAVLEIIKNLERAVSEDEPMLIAQWSGQLKNWLYRWAEIAEKWRDHPLVQLYAPSGEV